MTSKIPAPKGLQDIRKARKITALRLAEMVGVRETTIFRWQAGKGTPTWRQAKILADALGCTPEDLFPLEEVTV